MKPSELRIFHERLRSFRVVLVFMRALRNSRSYKLIINALFSLPSIQKALLEFNQIKFAEAQRRNRSC